MKFQAKQKIFKKVMAQLKRMKHAKYVHTVYSYARYSIDGGPLHLDVGHTGDWQAYFNGEHIAFFDRDQSKKIYAEFKKYEGRKTKQATTEFLEQD